MTVLLHSGDPVHVHTSPSHFDGCDGRIAAPDPDGGYEVDFGDVHCHFERSELEPLVMVRCAADQCTTTHLLPPGSSWLCVAHQLHITVQGGS